MLFSAQIHDFIAWLPWVHARREQKAMRAIVEQRRRIMSEQEVQEQSALIIAQLEQMSAFQEAKVVLLYYPIHNEVDLRPLLTKYEGQKTFLLPVTHRHSMEVRPYDGEDMMRKGRMGVPEPQTETYKGHIDLILVPGVVFDNHCHRIGRGGGYYDKYLSKHPLAKKIGVCYNFQLKKHDIPHLWHDHKMDRVITPQKTIG
jgi:5-formyltetrahydrofolate cyclo-ligase